MILAIPDKRYCFDYLRPLSTAGQVMEAYFERRRGPPFSVIYDRLRNSVHFDTTQAWCEEPYRGPFESIFTPEVAFAVADEARRTGSYIDCHCWVFTHASFMQIINEANIHGVATIRVLRHESPVSGSNEFHVVVAPGRR